MESVMSLPRSPQFGAVLFRASELIAHQGDHVFNDLGVGVGAGKISIILAINQHGPLTSTELSRRIGHSRQVIESRLKSSVADGFFVSAIDPKDSRRRIYDFSDEARPTVACILSIMLDFEKVYDALWQEIGVDLEAGLKAMERGLSRTSLTERLCREFPNYEEQLETGDLV
jgi:DNA-binding MarR family transcriptional regulator